MKTHSTSETSRGLIRTAVLLMITALAFSMSTAFGATTAWQVGTDTWFYGPNWTNGEPDSTTDAFINNGGTAQITLDFGQAVAHSLTLGLNADQWGTVEVSAPNGGLTVGQAIFVGYRGKGTLVITDGDSVMSASASIASLTNTLLPPSQGSVTLNGGGLWTLGGRFDVGGYNDTPGGVALLNVTNGSTVSAGSVRVYSSGTLTGDGTLSTSSGTTIGGTIEPSGTAPNNDTLTISSGDLIFCSSSGCSPLMESNVVPAGADNVNVSHGSASLSGKLSVSMCMTCTFTPGTTYTLLHAAGGLNGTTFSSQSITYPTGQNFTPVIQYDYNNNNVNLYLQPNT
jgi:T5SS/PEP-CTERM-associated repeat protein